VSGRALTDIVVSVAEHGRAIIEEVQFKGGSDITEGGKMEFSLSERKACSPPTRFQGTLLFKDGEPVKDLDQRCVNSCRRLAFLVIFAGRPHAFGRVALAPARCDRRPESQLVIETHFAVDSNESEASFSTVANPPASTFLLTPLLRHNDQLDVFDRSSSVVNVTTLSLSHRYPHGTQVTFHCVSGILRDKTTWQIICEEGNWIGRPLACGTNRLLTPQ